MHPQFTPSETARFWSHVNFDGPIIRPELGPCWVWTASGVKGYGKFGLRGRDGPEILSHRYSYLQLVGEIPDGLFILHRCDNPPCVRPEHLFPGTAADNSADMMSKGRYPTGDRHWTRRYPEKIFRGEPRRAVMRERAARGESHVCAKLTETQVREIRSRAGEKQHILAQEFGVARSHISNILHRKSWRLLL